MSNRIDLDHPCHSAANHQHIRLCSGSGVQSLLPGDLDMRIRFVGPNLYLLSRNVLLHFTAHVQYNFLLRDYQGVEKQEI